MRSMTSRPGLRRRYAVQAAAAAATAGLALTGSTAQAQAKPTASWATAKAATVSTSATSAYTCFVTYPGGSTNVSYSLTFTGSAPATVGTYHPYTAQVDFPVITPNPNINQQVQDVAFKLQLPADAILLTYRLSGGGVTPTVTVEGTTVVLKAHGPFPGAQPFQFPSISFLLLAGPSGTEALSQAGTDLSDPSFSWVRTDLQGTLRPFACFLPAATPLTATTVTP
jgi:dehydratase